MAPTYQPTQVSDGRTRLSDRRVDRNHMRAANMGLVLRHLRAHGGRSRSRLADETGLSKASMSSLVADLVDRGLVREGEPDREGVIGRPGLTVEVDGGRVCGVGVEINVDYVALTAVDLAGAVIREFVVPMAVPSLAADEVIDRVGDMIARSLNSLREAGLKVVAVTVSPPGVIDYDTGSVRFSPNIGWQEVPLVAELASRLGAGAPPIRIENDAKLAAVAEYSFYETEGVRDLIYLTGDVGVGAGIIAAGHPIRGWSGFSGEVGHLQLDPENRPCSCGRTGCWETIVGLAALLRLAAPDDDVANDLNRPMEDRLAVIRRRADAGDPRTLTALGSIATDLARGLSVLVDVLNPRVIVLGGYFAFFGDYLLGPLEDALALRRMDAGSGVQLTVSRLGIASASRGGALSALEDVFNDPTIVEV